MQKYILFYSKYSKHCLAFIDKLKSNKINLPIDTLCVDNEIIRNKIISSKNIKIETVPCLLIIQNSSVSKYEANDLVLWIDDIIEKKEASEKNKQKLVFNEEPQQFHPKHYVPPIKHLDNKQQINNENTNDLIVQSEENKNSTTNFTSIDEINSEEEDENFNIIDNGDDTQENISTNLVNVSNDNSTNLGNSNSNNALNKKRNGLMAMALQMQKSRESEDGGIQKNPYKSF